LHSDDPIRDRVERVRVARARYTARDRARAARVPAAIRALLARIGL